VDYIHSVSIPGTATGDALPPQIACSVTELTDARKHWGRFYLPGFGEADNNPTGTLANLAQITIANEAKVLYDRWNAMTDTNAVVWGRITAQSQYNSPIVPDRPFPSWFAPPPPVTTLVTGAYAVQKIRVDELWDVIRRRRYQSALVRETRALAQ
jgi:hypothetical protein